MRPHPEDTNYFFVGKNLIHNTVLNIDPARICASQITNQFFKRRRILEWVLGKKRQQFQRLGFQTAGSKLLSILHCLLGINKLPTHHSSAFELSARGSAMPALMDSRMPGTANRNKVS